MVLLLMGFGFEGSPQFQRSFGLYYTDYDRIFVENPMALQDVELNHLYFAYWAPDWTVPVSFGDFLDNNLGGAANQIFFGFVNAGKSKSAGGITAFRLLSGRQSISKSDDFTNSGVKTSYTYSGFYDPASVPKVNTVNVDNYLITPNALENVGASFTNEPSFGSATFDTSSYEVAFAVPRFRVRARLAPSVIKENFSGDYSDNLANGGTRHMVVSLTSTNSAYIFDGFFALRKDLGFGAILGYSGGGYETKHFASNYTDRGAGNTVYRAFFESSGDSAVAANLENLVRGVIDPEDFADALGTSALAVPQSYRGLNFSPYVWSQLSLLGFDFELNFALPFGFTLVGTNEVFDSLYANSTRVYYTNATAEMFGLYLNPQIEVAREIAFDIAGIKFLSYPSWVNNFYFGSMDTRVSTFSSDLSPLGGSDASITGNMAGKALSFDSVLSLPVGFELPYKRFRFYLILNNQLTLAQYRKWSSYFDDVKIVDSSGRKDYGVYSRSEADFNLLSNFATDVSWYVKTDIVEGMNLLFWVNGLNALTINSKLIDSVMFSITYSYSGPLFNFAP